MKINRAALRRAAQRFGAAVGLALLICAIPVVADLFIKLIISLITQSAPLFAISVLVIFLVGIFLFLYIDESRNESE